jgi:hypothetical protein
LIQETFPRSRRTEITIIIIRNNNNNFCHRFRTNDRPIFKSEDNVSLMYRLQKYPAYWTKRKRELGGLCFCLKASCLKALSVDKNA